MILSKQARMVSWYNPKQLGRTAYQIFLSTTFGRHADRRLLAAFAGDPDPKKEPYFDFSKSDAPFWFDYIADVGDGFDSTYTMARCVTSPLAFDTPQAADRETESGKILILGGDEVYPVASDQNYQERLIYPYNAAFPKKRHGPAVDESVKPTVFAIPGNHDWYDSLVAFSDLFCEGKDFCGWRTLQKRSYFALRLPKGWWLFGTDMQLGSSLDKPQVAYFSKVMEFVPRADRIILCNAEPHWINAELFKRDPSYSDRKMRQFAASVLRGQVAVYAAGDRHYYRRHEEVSKNGKPVDPGSTAKRQKITAGGGGAFLHPTHKEDLGRIGKSHVYELKASFPDAATSRRLGRWNLLFPLWNVWFGLLMAFLYLLTARAFLSRLGTYEWTDIYSALRTVAHDALTEPFSLYWVLLFFVGFIFFTETSSKLYRWIAGPFHALAHLGAPFIISWQVSYWLSGGQGLNFNSIVQLTEANLLIFFISWLVGSAIMGVYLFVSLNIFGRHHNEAFSSLKIADYKNFLRFKIEQGGDLVIYPVGVRKVIKQWRSGDRNLGETAIMPRSITDMNRPILIEPPIRYEKPFDGSAPSQAPAPPAVSTEIPEAGQLQKIDVETK